MRRKMLICALLYYLLVLFVYAGFFFLSSLALEAFGRSESLGTAIAVTYGVLFIATPVGIAVLMRFSLLRWYVDPFAAAEIPLFLYCGMLISQMRHTKRFTAAVLLLNAELGDDDGMGWIFLAGLFILGLAASFSVARTKGKSISYRMIARIFSERRKA